MQANSLSAMDIYSSDMTIPLDIATYCRGCKLAPESVRLRWSIGRFHAAKLQLQVAEQALEVAQQEMSQAIQTVRSRMEREDAA